MERVVCYTDPHVPGVHHCEALLPFHQAARLEPGDAWMRAPDPASRSFRRIMRTARQRPAAFHLLNRGLTYACASVSLDRNLASLRISFPHTCSKQVGCGACVRYGLVDGGQTLGVIRTVNLRRGELLSSCPGWVEPHVRVHFFTSTHALPFSTGQIAKTLNLSVPTPMANLADHSGAFDELKEALRARGFDPSVVSFRANEARDWPVEEVIQRLACFLPRWSTLPPLPVYRSTRDAMKLYLSHATRDEFRPLYPLIDDILTLPEFIQATFSEGGVVPLKKYALLRVVETLDRCKVRLGTQDATRHLLHRSALLPMASAFREALELRDQHYEWRVNPRDLFSACAAEMYSVLFTHLIKGGSVSKLGLDAEYWNQCAQVIRRALQGVATRM